MRRLAGSKRTGGSGRNGSTSLRTASAPSGKPPPARRKGKAMTNDATAQAGELSYTRVFDAPRGLVFRCMTEPEHLTHFWGPVGVSTPIETITADVRPGGVFETVMVNDADGSSYTMRAVHVEAVAPERLVWNDPDTGMTPTSTLTHSAA